MELPVYVTVEEVQRVCQALKIRDWTQLADAKVTPEEARVILQEVNTEGMPIPLVDFVIGLEVELEHGTRFQDANVTNNHPILTGKIVLAHLKETMDYYQRLDVAELEGRPPQSHEGQRRGQGRPKVPEAAQGQTGPG